MRSLFRAQPITVQTNHITYVASTAGCCGAGNATTSRSSPPST
jgi:hypothetical protein